MTPNALGERRLDQPFPADSPRWDDCGSTMDRNWVEYFVSEEVKKENSARISGEPGRTRTYNPLIKSQLLYH